MGSCTHSEEDNTLPEHFKSYPSNIEKTDRNSQESNNAQTTRSLELCSQQTNKIKINMVFEKLS